MKCLPVQPTDLLLRKNGHAMSYCEADSKDHLLNHPTPSIHAS